MALNPHVKICTHVMVTGVRCGSPALRGARFCYFHERMLNGVPTPKHARIHPIALLENEEAIQVALMEVVNAVLRNAIDNQRASLILRALNIAVRNARRVRFIGHEDQMVRQSLEPHPAAAPAAALARIPLPGLRRAAHRVSKPAAALQSNTEQLRRSERMQPTAQAVGTEQSQPTSPGGAKEIFPRNGSTPESETKTADRKNTEGAPSLRSVQEPALSESKGWELRTPAPREGVAPPRKPPARVASAVVAQAKAAINATPIGE
jgi:hypothetical protein